MDQQKFQKNTGPLRRARGCPGEKRERGGHGQKTNGRKEHPSQMRSVNFSKHLISSHMLKLSRLKMKKGRPNFVAVYVTMLFTKDTRKR